jgi:triosephosphate isomerase
MLTDMGVNWAVVGHSERRGKGEANAEIAIKAKYALDKGLSVIACCGEPLESREAGTTNDYVFPQIQAYADVFTSALGLCLMPTSPFTLAPRQHPLRKAPTRIL